MMVAMQEALDAVLGLLDLEPIEVNIFRGTQPGEDRQRVFGGQVAGQALVAAARTVDEGSVHSLHSYFLRPGDPSVPILYEVDRIRDGRSFTTRRVVAIQHGRAIFNLQASFHIVEDGFEHQAEMPDVPDPDTLPSRSEIRAADPDAFPAQWPDRPQPIDIRYVSDLPYRYKPGRPPAQQVWMRANGTMGDDPLQHTCVLAYLSDMTLLDTCALPHLSPYRDDVMGASLDHLMWFHRPFRADEWMLYAMDSPSAQGARGFNRGQVFSRDGTLIASVAQEGLMRVKTR